MLKFLIPIILIFIVGLGSVRTYDIKEDITSYVKSLKLKLKEIYLLLQNARNVTNNTEIIENVNIEVVESFSQSAQFQNTTGVRDPMLPKFVSSILGRMEIPSEYLKNLTLQLSELTKLENSQWQSFKFIYTKPSNQSSNCYYVNLYAQHNILEGKSNWIYSQFNSKINTTDMFVISRTERYGGFTKESVEVIKKPAKYQSNDLDLLIQFYEAISIRSLQNYFHLSDNNIKTSKQKEYGRDLENLLFLQ
jgi:hypothetical protein